MVTEKKIVIIGDGFTGKSCMANAYKYNRFTEMMAATMVEEFSVEVNRNGEIYNMRIVDIVGQEQYDAVISYLMKHNDAIILCYAVNLPASYKNVCRRWMKMLSKIMSNPKIILVATKLDTRDDNDPEHITTKMGKKLMKKIKAEHYVECSSKLMFNINTVFEKAYESTFEKPRQKSCTFL